MKWMAHAAAGMIVAVVVIAYFAFPREVQVIKPFPANPSAQDITDVVENVATLHHADETINGAWYSCAYYDTTNDVYALEAFDASMMWCIRNPELELPPPGTTSP